MSQLCWPVVKRHKKHRFCQVCIDSDGGFLVFSVEEPDVPRRTCGFSLLDCVHSSSDTEMCPEFFIFDLCGE